MWKFPFVTFLLVSEVQLLPDGPGRWKPCLKVESQDRIDLMRIDSS